MNFFVATVIVLIGVSLFQMIFGVNPRWPLSY